MVQNNNEIEGPGFKYTDLNVINHGSYGQIISAIQHPSGKKVILKKILKREDDTRVASEILAGHALKGVEGVASFHHFFETSSSYWLVFDQIEGSDLFQCLATVKSFPERTVKKMLKQLVATLREVHSKGFSHKDIKLENILFDFEKKSVSLIDFGLCHSYGVGSDRCTDYAGSREYACPEMVLASTESFSSNSADVWALGVTMFTLLYGVFPFAFDQEEQDMIDRRGIHPRPCFPHNPNVSSQAVDLLQKMIEINPAKRITLKEIEKHPFLKKTLGRSMKQFLF